MFEEALDTVRSLPEEVDEVAMIQKQQQEQLDQQQTILNNIQVSGACGQSPYLV